MDHLEERIQEKQKQKEKLEREISEKYQKYIDRYDLIGGLVLESEEKAEKIIREANEKAEQVLNDADQQAETTTQNARKAADLRKLRRKPFRIKNLHPLRTTETANSLTFCLKKLLTLCWKQVRRPHRSFSASCP